MLKISAEKSRFCKSRNEFWILSKVRFEFTLSTLELPIIFITLARKRTYDRTHNSFVDLQNRNFCEYRARDQTHFSYSGKNTQFLV